MGCLQNSVFINRFVLMVLFCLGKRNKKQVFQFFCVCFYHCCWLLRSDHREDRNVR